VRTCKTAPIWLSKAFEPPGLNLAH
jgi:hypothetical protein